MMRYSVTLSFVFPVLPHWHMPYQLERDQQLIPIIVVNLTTRVELKHVSLIITNVLLEMV